MSQANASARKRRGVPPSPPTPTFSQPNQSQKFTQSQSNLQQQQQNGFTLQQVIGIIDKRLITLEQNLMSGSNVPSSVNKDTDPLQNEINNEFNERFNMIALEVNDLKDKINKQDDEIRKLTLTVMNLQTLLIQQTNSQIKVNDDKEDN